MIFWQVPSVQQVNPDHLFGEGDNIAFLESVEGLVYDSRDISQLCAEYFGKLDNPRYWGQIITLHNFLCTWYVDEGGFIRVPSLLKRARREWDNGSTLFGRRLVEYLLGMWQYPHPTMLKKNEKDYPTIKPFAKLLKLLLALGEVGEARVLTEKDFYYVISKFTASQGRWFEDMDSAVSDLLGARRMGLYQQNPIGVGAKKKPYLSYPKGFLLSSSLLVDEVPDSIEVNDIVVCYLSDVNVERARREILFSESQGIFDRGAIRSNRNVVKSQFARHVYDGSLFSKWSQLHVNSVAAEPDLIEWDAPVEVRGLLEEQLDRLGVLSVRREQLVRLEQHILRRHLFGGGDSGTCGLCGSHLPVQLLKTAHIKKRSECSDVERRDLNVVFPACDIGCDRLFEHGYIVVCDGIVNRGPVECDYDYLNSVIRTLIGREVVGFSELNSGYFDWHRKYHEKKSIR